MPGNTMARFDSVTRAFHWMTAILILTGFALGLVANAWPYDTADQLAVKARLFSTHKTLGVTIFFVSLGRIGWALTHRHPPPVHPERRLETLAARHCALGLVHLPHCRAADGLGPSCGDDGISRRSGGPSGRHCPS